MISDMQRDEEITRIGDRRLILEIMYQAARDVDDKRLDELVREEARDWLENYAWVYIDVLGLPVVKKYFDAWVKEGCKAASRKWR